MRRDRYGEPVEEVEDELPPIHRCVDGWTGEDDDGHPIPCTTCRPHLTKRRGPVWAEPPLRPGVDYA